MIYCILGASCAGKSTFIKNSWFNTSSLKRESKDILTYTETDNAFLLGKYINTDSRLIGCDRLPRLSWKVVDQQIKHFNSMDCNKNIVLDGHKVLSRYSLDKITTIGLPVTLLLITCDVNVSIQRNIKNGFKGTTILKATHTLASRLFMEYKNKVKYAEIINTNEFTENDFKTFGLNTMSNYLYNDNDVFILTHDK